MKATITSIKIISEANCDIGFTIENEDGKIIISDIVNIRSESKDRDEILSHIKDVLTDIKNKYVCQKESKLADEAPSLLHEEIEL